VEFLASGRKFSHSTWQGELLQPAEILKHNPQHVPRPNRMGQARAIVFGYCDGKRTFAQIEEAVLREHPALFPSSGEISRFVAQVLGKDSD
jgi:protein arginine N-methyltransferase 1